jgi:hypothetical protein
VSDDLTWFLTSTVLLWLCVSIADVAMNTLSGYE